MSEDRSTVLGSLLGAGLVATTLAVAPGVPHSFETPKDAVVGLTVGAGLVLAALGRTAALPHAVALPLLVFLATGVVASVGAERWTQALVLDGTGALLLVAGVAGLASTSARAQVARLLVAVASIQAVLAAVQLALGPAALNIFGTVPRRAYAFGTLGVPNWVGVLCAMALAPALLAPGGRRRVALLVFLLAIGLAVSGSRAAWLAALATLAVVGARAGRPLLAGAIGGVLVVVAAATALDHGPGSVGGRLLIWRATAGMIAAHPVLGVGPGGFASAYPAALHEVMRAGPDDGFTPSGFVVHPHNLLLTATAERGAAGLAAFVWLVAAIIHVGRSRDRNDWTRAAAAGTLVAFAVYGLFDHPFASTALAMAAWLAAAAWIAPDEATDMRPRRASLRVALAVAGVAVAAYGLAALGADRRLSLAWDAAAGGDARRAAEIAETVRVGPAHDDAYTVRVLAALGAGDPTAALGLLGEASRTDADIFYATAAARARSGDVHGGLGVLEDLAVTLPDLVGPHVVAAELRRAAGVAGVDEALARAMREARATAPNPRLDVLVALAAARGRDRQVVAPGGPLVVIDAGHGGDAAGARGEHGVVEKDVNLQLAKPLAAALRARGARVVLTRARDQAVPLDARARLANTRGADLFISLHANAGRDPAARGVEIYVRATDFEPDAFPHLSVRDRALLVNVLPDGFARAVAARRTLDRCALDAAVKLGEQLAPAAEMVPAILPAHFYLLRQVQAPAVLVEVGYLTNEDDERRLRRPSYRRALAGALAEGAMRTLAAGCRP